MPDLMDIRRKLYEVLTASEENDTQDVKVTQQMGVSLSHAMKKDGITIVQMQNVVAKRVIQHVTEALKLIDTIDLEQRLQDAELIEAQVEETPQIEDTRPTLDDYLDACITRGLSLKQFQEQIAHVYAGRMIEQFPGDSARLRLRVGKKRFDELRAQENE